MTLSRLFRRKSEQAEADKTAASAARAELMNGTALSTDRMSVRRTLKEAWYLMRPYFMESPDRNKARWMLLGIIGLMVAQVGAANWLNNINGHIWNSLTTQNWGGLGDGVKEMAISLPMFAVAVSVKQYLTSLLMMRWRNDMAKNQQTAWIDHGAYYGLQRQLSEKKLKDFEAGTGGKNAMYPESHPDQRLSADVNSFIFTTVQTGTSFLESLLMMSWFSTVLWNISGTLDVNVAGHSLAIPGYMMLLSLAYSGVGTIAAGKIGKGMHGKFQQRQNLEAQNRRALMRMQENAESIALAKGEKAEKKNMFVTLDSVLKTSFELAQQNRSLSGFNTAFSKASDLLPTLAMAPKLFAGAIDIGGLTRAVGAFGYVDKAMSWMVYSYGTFAEYSATTGRLAGFARATEDWNKNAAAHENKNILRHVFNDASAQAKVEVRGLEIDKPDGEKLIAPFDLDLKPGDRLVISGDAGSGKTTLFRALSGLWDNGHGAITINTPGSVLCVPQKAYLPDMTMRGIICYPGDPAQFDDGKVRSALGAAGLGEFEQDLDNEKITGTDWVLRLSGGQQQRLAFARIFLHRPEVLLLDEATSSLDPQAEKELYKGLTERLPESIVVSIAHNPSVAVHHNRKAHIKEGALSLS